MAQSYDIVIVGGGVMGASLAYNLAALDAGRVLLLEGNRLCSGDTLKSCAIVRTHYSNPTTCRMACIGRDILSDFDAVVGGQSGFVNSGYVIFAGEDAAGPFEENIRLQQGAGSGVESIDAAEALALHPKLPRERIAAAAYERASGYADPQSTVLSYAGRARDKGVEIREGVPVRGLVEQGDRVTGVETDEGLISAGLVVLCAGVWTNTLTRPLGVEYPYAITNHKVVTMAFGYDYTGDAFPVVRDISGFAYSRPRGRHMLLGDADRGEDVPRPDFTDETLKPDELEGFRRKLAYSNSDAAAAELVHHWAGRYDVSPDWNPIIGGIDGKDGLMAICGSSGGGFKLAPCIGLITAELIVHGQGRTLPVEEYAPSRFDDGAGGFRNAYGTGAIA